MHRIFLDTNVAFDLIANREPFVQDSLPFIILVENSEAKLFISEISVGTLIYLAFDRYKLTDAKGRLVQFMAFCSVISGGAEAFFNSMNSDFQDKEDGIQYFTARIHSMDFLVTRDKTDFVYGDDKFPILTPQEFFA